MSQLPPGVELQALPEPYDHFREWTMGDDPIDVPGFTADQMRSIEAKAAQAGFDAGLDAAAKVCEQIADEYQEREGHRYPEMKSDANEGALKCEDAIRSLKGKQ